MRMVIVYLGILAGFRQIGPTSHHFRRIALDTAHPYDTNAELDEWKHIPRPQVDRRKPNRYTRNIFSLYNTIGYAGDPAIIILAFILVFYGHPSDSSFLVTFHRIFPSPYRLFKGGPTRPFAVEEI